MPEIGHNSKAGGTLGKFIQRIENLNDDIDALRDDVKDVKAEAKAAGFNPKIIAKVLARRKRERADVEEEDALIELYEDQVKAFMAKVMSD